MATEDSKVLHRGELSTGHRSYGISEPYAAFPISFCPWIPYLYGSTAVLVDPETPCGSCRTPVSIHSLSSLGDRGSGRICRPESSDQSLPKSVGDHTCCMATRSEK